MEVSTRSFAKGLVLILIGLAVLGAIMPVARQAVRVWPWRFPEHTSERYEGAAFAYALVGAPASWLPAPP